MKRVALIFPGQGAYHAGALRQIRLTQPGVQRVLDAVETVARRRFQRSLLDTIWNEQNHAARLLETDPAMLQLAIYALSVAAFEILQAEGVEHEVLMGHSFGEIAALTCAGVFTVEAGAEIVCDRVEALAEAAPRDGRMAAVSAGREQTVATIEHYAARRGMMPPTTRLQIAVENSDFQTVVSGGSAEIEGFVAHCSATGISARRLDSPYAFHHPGLAAAAAAFSRRLGARACTRPNRPVYSPIARRFYDPDEDFRAQLAQHLTETVDFRAAVRRLDAIGINVFIECGALDALTKNIIRVLGPGKSHTFPTLGQQADDLTHVTRIIHHLKPLPRMKRNSVSPMTSMTRPDFEALWNERSPVILAQLKAEFVKLLNPEWLDDSRETEPVLSPAVGARITTLNGNGNGNGHGNGTAHVDPNVRGHANGHSNANGTGNANGNANGNGSANGHAPSHGDKTGAGTHKASKVSSRAQMFDELVAIYADAMEYPREVFKDEVELEAELGIDSVKQSEIIRRISTQYQLALPTNFRPGDFKTMGQIVDFVFTHHGQSTATAA